jgi:hypothetical protein
MISMDTRRPLQVMSISRHQCTQGKTHAIHVECADPSPKRRANIGTTRPTFSFLPRTSDEYTYPARGNKPSFLDSPGQQPINHQPMNPLDCQLPKTPKAAWVLPRRPSHSSILQTLALPPPLLIQATKFPRITAAILSLPKFWFRG